MKKFITSLVAGVAVIGSLTLAGCGSKKTYEYALITDIGTIDDRSFNQGAWEGLKAFAVDNAVNYKYYKPKTKSTDDYVKAIDLAVDNGAEYIVTPGYLFENAVYIAQTKYPTVKFILLDGSPHNVTDWGTMATLTGTGDADFTGPKANVSSIFYAEQESGFYAGYAAVLEGYRSLGFAGGMAVPAVIRFGYGFVAGAYLAAEELEVAVTVKYKYLGDFAPSPAHQTLAEGWYTEGVEVIFAAAGGAGNSIMKAAEAKNKKAIGVDVDQSAESKTVITSAMKDLKGSVYSALTKATSATPTAGSGNQIRFGASVTLTSVEGGVGLPDDFSRFVNFRKMDYYKVYGRVADGLIEIPADTSKLAPTDESAITAAQIKAWFDANNPTLVDVAGDGNLTVTLVA